MREPRASYGFLPWLRQGIASEITRVDSGDAAGVGGGTPRAEVPIRLSIEVGGIPRAAEARLGLYGPGEVAGIDPRVIIRTYPRPGAHDAESNLFPLVEFDPPDFPWRYTPARAGTGDRLRPWLVLIAVADDEIEPRDEQPQGTGLTSTGGALPAITVRHAASLPDLGQSWAWAHVQVTGYDGQGQETVAAIADRMPHRVLARLLCPRRLGPGTAYTAFVVPAFERGRRAGLGEPLDDNLDALTPAWAPGDAAIRLPVYYQWRFQTAAAGDFEYLVRLLRARAVPAGVGQRPLDVSDPGQGLPPAASTPLGLEGALMSPASRGSAWDPQERAAFVAALQHLVNRPAVLLAGGADRRLVVPPLYGGWHAARDRLQPGARPPWFHQLNADPRWRVAAGLGTLVVQSQQQALLAGAWERVEGVLRLNEQLRQAQLAREVATRVQERHVMAHDAETALLVTAPLHARLRASPLTVAALLERSPIAPGALQGALRRTMRPLGPIGRRQGRPAAHRGNAWLGRLNRGSLAPAPPPPVPEGMATPQRTGAGLVPAWASDDVRGRLRALGPGLLLLGLLLLTLALVLALTAGAVLALAVVLALLGVTALAGGWLARRGASRLDLRAGLRAGRISPADILHAPAARSFVPAEAALGSHVPRQASGPAGRQGDRRAVADLRAALAEMVAEAYRRPAPTRPLVPVDLAGLRETVVAGLDPRRTVLAGLRARMRVPAWADRQPQDPLEPPLAAPEFERPMYEPLRDLGQEWLLPGVGRIPANTVTLLATNQRFLESYMVGLNHEMARELLWNEYPTDQRGTYFRQFWDVRGAIPWLYEEFDPEVLKDIKPIAEWDRDAPLGANSSRVPPIGAGQLVLLVRGEVLQRYPNTIVYGQRARRAGDGRREPGEEQRHPLFHGTLPPDIAFFGFALTSEQVRGSRDPDGDQGWYIVLQEQPSEPRFGLDAAEGDVAPLTRWSDLAWGHLAPRPDALGGLVNIDLNADLPDTRLIEPGPDEQALAWHADRGLGAAGATSADLAAITLQAPFRVAVHGSDMLPPEGDD